MVKELPSKSGVLPILIILVFLTISLFSVQNYGITWDEGTQRVTGIINYLYVFEGNQALLEYNDRDYGVAFELPLVILEEALKIESFRSIYIMRHLLSHLLFLFASFIFYKLTLQVFKNKWLAIISMLMLLLMPRIYAHSFFNSKDLPFLSVFIISFYYMTRALLTKKWTYIIVTGVCLGLLINIRLMGVLLLFITGFFFFVDAFKEGRHKEVFLKFATLIVISCIVLYFSWPYLWENPLHNFYTAFRNMSKFRWDGTLLFNGEVIHGTDVKANYIPTWIGITTPISYLIIFVFGSIWSVIQFVKKPTEYVFNNEKRIVLIAFLVFYGSVGVIVILNSVLYDGWRQVYYIYPWLIFLGIYFLSEIWYKLTCRRLFLSVLCISFVLTASFMVSNTSLMQVYFNPLVSMCSRGYISQSFEMDYWGSSYKEIFERLAKGKKTVRVFADHGPAKENLQMLEENLAARIELVENREDAMFFVTIYRNVYKRYPELEPYLYEELKVHGSRVAAIYKIN